MSRALKQKNTVEVDPDKEAPRYQVMEKSFIDHALVDVGAEIIYLGDTVGDNLSPINDAAQAVVDAQTQPHTDKSAGAQVSNQEAEELEAAKANPVANAVRAPKAAKASKDPRRAADAAAAATPVAATPATPTDGPTGAPVTTGDDFA